MDKFLIKGGNALHGTVAISGAKNSALPVMAATLLTSEKVTLHNIPKVRDLITMSKLLAFMSAKVSITEIPASDYVIDDENNGPPGLPQLYKVDYLGEKKILALEHAVPEAFDSPGTARAEHGLANCCRARRRSPMTCASSSRCTRRPSITIQR